jgi:hypothetical protein
MIRNGEKELYHIFNDLKLHGRTTFSYPDVRKQQGIARSIGLRVKPFVDRKLMVPPLSSTNKHRMTGVQLPIGVKLKEKKELYGSRFYFQRKKNI